MKLLTKIGERLYGFNDTAAVKRARALYAHCTGSQNEFEEQMKNDGIEFALEPQS